MCADQVMDLRNGFVRLCYNPNFVSSKYLPIFNNQYHDKVYVLVALCKKQEQSDFFMAWIFYKVAMSSYFVLESSPEVYIEYCTVE